MTQIINITDKLTSDKPKIQVGEKVYEVNNGMSTVLKFEELQSAPSVNNMITAIEIALGEGSAEELKVKEMSFDNFRVVTTAILAAMQGVSYEEAESRFQERQQS